MLVALLLVGMASAAEPEAPLLVCLSDGQSLSGTRLVHVQDDTNTPATIELEVGGAFVRIPPYAGTAFSPEYRACRGKLRWSLGHADELRIAHLPGDQRVYGHTVTSAGGDTVIELLDRERIFVPPELVLDVTAPEKKDRIVATARRKQALHVMGLTAATTFIAGAVVFGAVTCPECFILSGL